MPDFVKTVIPAAIALIGTVLTVYVGYRQWRRQQDVARKQRYVTDRQDVYKELFEQLEEIHVTARTKPYLSAADPELVEFFRRSVTAINSYMLRKSLYIDQKDILLANDYLESLQRFVGLVMDSKDDRIRQGEMVTTPRLRVEALDEHERIKTAWENADTIRDKLIKKCKAVIGGDEGNIKQA